MLKSRHKSKVAQSVSGEQIRVNCSTHASVILVCLLLLFSGCRRDMQDQPKMKPLRESTFFRDRLSARPLIEGTVPRGYLREDSEFFTGKKISAQRVSGQPVTQGATPTTPQPTAGPSSSTAAQTYPDDIEVFPFQVTEDTVKRGKERYEIFCSVCHGSTGYGDGIVVRRGFRRAASFHDDRLRQAPVGHFFDAITNGWGAMPSYASQIPPQDRWAIVAYIRALQLSQQNPQAQAGAAPSPSPRSSPSGGSHP